MNIHEFQAKYILKKYGIPLTEYAVISNIEELSEALDKLKLNEAVLKIQVHAGGRGKAGGVKIGKNRKEIEKAANTLLGMKLVNHQTGPEGVVAHQVLISPIVEIKKEYYLGAIIDRKKAQAILIASPEGGMDIEEVAEKFPERIMRVPIGLGGDLKPFQQLKIAEFMGWKGDVAKQGMQLAKNMAKAFMEMDASLLEINPLALTTTDELLALDAKLSIDENALYRQPEIASYYDSTQIPANEAAAKEYDLAYVALEGEIGCMVNGAGLAMATMDLIHHYGGTPANFLDVGGGATQEKVAKGFKIILADPKVKVILVNIFGGIMNCATLAGGMISAANELKVSVPFIIRMEGTNVEKGKKMLQDSKINFVIADSLAEAAEKAVSVVKK
ncbi:ADP-forming succinate--CoA ligase subunit beta [Parachlamydia sp. AcF125]|uniref:ADP-forming succinate--CoA ligase subunit beta n=1 Tax=Parachlamydia sp. AcF125 TaxID=2795736 RepID=UPI001BCA6665|nr:ADP-forming succinate--CoA ligase subunit beta [Parachlamydia sp. AcF125]MBS4167573.1 Succinate--CoA ligase [ADP-forming] subunit beta [Parachlamydia sp. AcF125]